MRSTRRSILLSLVVAASAMSVLFASTASAEPTAASMEARARAAIARATPFAAKASLTATKTAHFGDGDTILRFAQMHQGLPVIGRGAAVRVTKSGETTFTSVDLEDALPASVVPLLAASTAASTAARFSRVGASAGDAHLVVWPLRGGGSRLAWAVVPSVPTGIPTAPRVIVDAMNGKVLEARDTVVFAGQASVYRFNPVTTPNLELVDLPILPDGAALTNPFVRSTNCLDQKTVKPLNLGFFKTNVHVCDLVQTATADGNGDYVYPPSDEPGSMAARSDTFSEVSMYYHASKAYQFFRTLQGDASAQVTQDKPLPVIANLQIPAGISSGNIAEASNPDTPLEPFMNAFFSPAVGGLGEIFSQLYGLNSGALWFGQGPQRDYSYDGDVVYHEFTHAVVDDTLKLEAWHIDARGAVDAPGAMNEGLADYFSSAITGDPNVGEYASKDLSAGLTSIRTLANSDACPKNVIGEAHADSTLFSGALWQARTSLPEADRPKLDAAIYKAMRLNPGRGDLGYDDLAKLFDATLTTDFPAGAAALEAAMKDRGVLPSCDRVIEYTADGVHAPDKSLGGFAAPGVTSLGTSDLAPGIIQIHVKFTDGTPAKVGVTFKIAPSSGGGATDLLGGQSTPFAPLVLAKFGKPITWTVKSGSAAHDADVKVPVSGTTGNASIDVPDGATEVYLQIASSGESDGAYDDVMVALTPRADQGDPTPAGPTAEPSSGSDDSGCGCSTVGRERHEGHGAANGGAIAALAVALGAAAASARRRRR